MFTYFTEVRLKDTDATGVLYFAEQFKFALVTFEEFLKVRGFAWKDLMASPYFLPVVHAQSDYLAPLMVGDPLEITLTVGELGTSSIPLNYTFRNPEKNCEVGRAKIIHVLVDKQTRASVPIPDFLREILSSANAALEPQG
jgi:YbgC/YbaW family acyl-CoA thioester hydrolase